MKYHYLDESGKKYKKKSLNKKIIEKTYNEGPIRGILSRIIPKFIMPYIEIISGNYFYRCNNCNSYNLEGTYEIEEYLAIPNKEIFGEKAKNRKLKGRNLLKVSCRSCKSEGDDHDIAYTHYDGLDW